MATRTLRLRGDRRGLYLLFRALLRDINFTVIHEEHLGGGFRVVGVNKKRVPQWASALLSLVGGYIPRKRVAIELTASERDGILTVDLECVPYLDILDMEAAVESQEERDMCTRLAEIFEERILEAMEPRDQAP
ncbi:MAG: hypothetical protein ACE5OO_03840 [Candidatus Bathyarchaeia archaeon]